MLAAAQPSPSTSVTPCHLGRLWQEPHNGAHERRFLSDACASIRSLRRGRCPRALVHRPPSSLNSHLSWRQPRAGGARGPAWPGGGGVKEHQKAPPPRRAQMLPVCGAGEQADGWRRASQKEVACALLGLLATGRRCQESQRRRGPGAQRPAGEGRPPDTPLAERQSLRTPHCPLHLPHSASSSPPGPAHGSHLPAGNSFQLHLSNARASDSSLAQPARGTVTPHFPWQRGLRAPRVPLGQLGGSPSRERRAHSLARVPEPSCAPVPFLRNSPCGPAGVAQRAECHPMNQEVSGLMPRL